METYFILMSLSPVGIYSLDSFQITTIRDSRRSASDKGFSREFSGKLSERPSDELVREECLVIHSQMLGLILFIPGALPQSPETWQKEVILSPKLVQK